MDPWTDRARLAGIAVPRRGRRRPSGGLPAAAPAGAAARGRLVILAAGKAAGSMTEVAEQHYLGADAAKTARRRSRSPATATAGRRNSFRSSKPAIRCRTPPASRRPSAALALADAVDADDLVLVLLSGGASANWIAPAAGLTLAEKQAVTRALLAAAPRSAR